MKILTMRSNTQAKFDALLKRSHMTCVEYIPGTNENNHIAKYTFRCNKHNNIFSLHKGYIYQLLNTTTRNLVCSVCKNETRTNIVEKFYANREEQFDGCINYTGNLNNIGYGQISYKQNDNGIGGKVILAHRLSYELHKGPIPKGKVIMHMCDNKACTNPDHLQIGTYSDNALDCIQKNGKPNTMDINDVSNMRDDFRRLTSIMKPARVYEVLVDKYHYTKPAIYNCIKRNTFNYVV